MEKVLPVGIIGLGRRWRKRYKPALAALRGKYTVRVLCDQRQQRALAEAQRLGCEVATGPTQVLERHDIDAVLLLDTQWFRLWPLERACQLGRPVLCCSSLEWDNAHADALHRQVEESRVPVVMEMAPRFAPVTACLHHLFETELGAPTLLLGDLVHPRPVPRPIDVVQDPVAGLLGGAGIALVDWCAGLLGAEPMNVMARRLEQIGFSSLLLEFAGGKGVQITRRHGRGGRRAVRLQIVAERGSAAVEPPYRVSWTTADGMHSHTLRRQRPLGQSLLEHFWQVVQGEVAPKPTLGDAYRILGWLRGAARSRDEGRLLSLTG